MELGLLIFVLVLALGFIGNLIRVREKIHHSPLIQTKPDSFQRKNEVFYEICFCLWWLQLFLYSLAPTFILDLFPSIYSAFFIFDPIGYVALYAGLILFVTSIISLGDSWRIGIDNEEPGPLVMKGLYKHIRHPIYTGVFLMLLGSLLILPNIVSLFLSLCCGLGVLLEAHFEEQFLLSRYKFRYEEYMKTTGRFLPKKLF
ncbi:MAG: isoprenylcysteine carboxylmethyltransferase family protein [Deltaproteobacteria bacterium]|nr:isoprenylcysteine carboxylmethyltransferase family protein [Deltaproteobacteria bacterium]